MLAHPGGGGDTYVDLLDRVDGYRTTRLYLARSPDATSPGAWARLPGRVPAVARAARRHDLVHVHGEVAAELCLPVVAAVPSVVTLHGLHLLRRTRGARRRAAAVGLRLVVAAADRTICVSRAEHDDVVAVVGDRGARRLRVVLNGVELPAAVEEDERARTRAELGIPSSALVGVYVGGLDRHKDPLVPARAVVEIARDGGDIVLLVAGDGPLRPELEGLARTPGGEAVRPLGHRTPVRGVLAAGDFFVLPSHREGLSFALLEAMALGLAPVVSDAPGNPEAVGEAGIVVRAGDPAGFERAFRRLLGGGDARALGERARERVGSEFRAHETVRGTRRVYDDVLGASGA